MMACSMTFSHPYSLPPRVRCCQFQESAVESALGPAIAAAHIAIARCPSGLFPYGAAFVVHEPMCVSSTHGLSRAESAFDSAGLTHWRAQFETRLRSDDDKVGQSMSAARKSLIIGPIGSATMCAGGTPPPTPGGWV